MGKIDWTALASGKKKKEKRDESYLFKLTEDEHSLRIVPFPLDNKAFNAEYFDEDNNLFVRLSSHNNDMIPFADDKMTLTLESIGEEDPICKFSKQLAYDNKFNETKEGDALRKIAKSMLPKREVYCCVINREDETPTPYLWKIPSFDKEFIPIMAKASTKLKKKLKIEDDDDDFYEFGENEGFDFTVESLVKEFNENGRSGSYRAVTSITFETESSPIAETKEELKEIYKNMVSPFSLFHIKSAKELKKILDKAKNGDDDDDDDEEEGATISSKPKPKSVTSVKKVLPKMDDDDGDDDEPPVKKTSKKIVEDEDEEDEDEKPVKKANAKNFNELFTKGAVKSKKAKATDDDDDDE